MEKAYLNDEWVSETPPKNYEEFFKILAALLFVSFIVTAMWGLTMMDQRDFYEKNTIKSVYENEK